MNKNILNVIGSTLAGAGAALFNGFMIILLISTCGEKEVVLAYMMWGFLVFLIPASFWMGYVTVRD